MKFVSRRQALKALLASAPVSAALAAESTGHGPRGQLSATDREVAAWPTRPVRLIVGFPAGSIMDLSARAIAPGLSTALGQPVIVENKAGASGTIAGAYVSRATDLHTFAVMNNSQATIAKLLNPVVQYDPATDLTPIAQIATSPLVVVVSAAATGNTPVDYVNWLRNLGNKGNYGSSGIGTAAHLGFELVKSRAALDTTHIPYPSNPLAIAAIINNTLQAGLMPPGMVMPHIKSGKLKAVGVTTEVRSAMAPGVSTLREADIRAAEMELWSALTGPKVLPAAIVEKMTAAVAAATKDAAISSGLLNSGWQASYMDAEHMRKRMNRDTATFGGIIMMRNIHADA